MQQPRYTSTAIALHWLMALMIIANFALGVFMTDIPGLTPAKLRYFSWHKWAGVTILLVATVRLLWRLSHTPPALPDTMPGWEKLAARASHLLLYVLLFAVPLSGYFYTLAAGVPVVYFGVIELPVLIAKNPALKPVLEGVHYWLNMLLAATVAVHVLAALKHQWIDHDSVLRRMLPVRT